MPEITESQIEQMKHALGMNYAKLPTRNFFYCELDDPEWNDLVEKGFAYKRPGWDDESAYFYVTEAGVNHIFAIIKG
ncbi:hypothetical protein MO973_19645 [Paenibacillus sp. TRM 82003]|nr:hypothetical protein [Paenibacillus sp. TRM 82003]